MANNNSAFSEFFSRIAEFFKNLIEKIKEISREPITLPVLRFVRDEDSEKIKEDIKSDNVPKEEKNPDKNEKDKDNNQEKENEEKFTLQSDGIIETENGKMVKTNMGDVPIEDFREIVAMQNGFDSYDDMYEQGYRLGNNLDKEPERQNKIIEENELENNDTTKLGGKLLEEMYEKMYKETFSKEQNIENNDKIINENNETLEDYQSELSKETLDVEKQEEFYIEIADDLCAYAIDNKKSFYLDLEDGEKLIFSYNNSTDDFSLSVVSPDIEKPIGEFSEFIFQNMSEAVAEVLTEHGITEDTILYELEPEITQEIENPEKITEENDLNIPEENKGEESVKTNFELTPKSLKDAIDNDNLNVLPNDISVQKFEMFGTTYYTISYQDNAIADYFPGASDDNAFSPYTEQSMNEILKSISNNTFEPQNNEYNEMDR